MTKLILVLFSQIMAADVRKSQRCIIDSVEKAAWLWQKVKDYVPHEWRHGENKHPVIGLNER